LALPPPVFDVASVPGVGVIDGIKVDRQGDLYVYGPGGLWVISPEGEGEGAVHPLCRR
jgi:gluconolactonase